MEQTLRGIPTESMMTMIEMHSEQARVLVQDLMDGYFCREDEVKAAQEVAVDFHKVATFIEILEGLLISIGEDCRAWNDWYREAHERAKKKGAA